MQAHLLDWKEDVPQFGGAVQEHAFVQEVSRNEQNLLHSQGGHVRGNLVPEQPANLPKLGWKYSIQVFSRPHDNGVLDNETNKALDKDKHLLQHQRDFQMDVLWNVRQLAALREQRHLETELHFRQFYLQRKHSAKSERRVRRALPNENLQIRPGTGVLQLFARNPHPQLLGNAMWRQQWVPKSGHKAQ